MSRSWYSRDVRTRPQNIVQIVIGDRFVTEAALLDSGDPARWVGRYDPDVLRAPIDVIVDRENLSADLPDEPVVPFLRRVAEATKKLEQGQRAVVEFSEAPIELVLEPWDGRHVVVSVIEFGRAAKFRTRRVRALSSHLLDELRHCVVSAADRASGSSAALSEALAPLRATLATSVGPPSAKCPAFGHVDIETRSHSGTSLTTHLQPDSTGLGADDVQGEIARFALMALGTVTLTGSDGRGLRLAGSPIRLLGSFVDALSDDYGGDDVMHAELARDDSGHLTASFREGRAALSHPSGKPLRVPTDELARLVSEHAAAVAESLRKINPRLVDHPDVRDLDESAATLREYLPRSLSLTGPMMPVVVSRPARHLDVPEPDGWAFPSSAIRRMRYERKWTLVRSGLLPRTVAHRPDDAGRRLTAGPTSRRTRAGRLGLPIVGDSSNAL